MAIIRLDKVAGIHLESVKSADVLKNGYFVELGGLVAGESELRQAGKPSDIEDGDIVFIAHPEVDPDPRKAGLKNFELEAGLAGRAYRLVKGDIMTMTADLFQAIPSIGDKVAPQVGSYIVAEFDALAVQPAVQLNVLQETTLGFDAQQAFVVQVVKG